jgi:hypothetical protein
MLPSMELVDVNSDTISSTRQCNKPTLCRSDLLMRTGQLSNTRLGAGLLLHHYSGSSTLPVNINDLMPEHIDSCSFVAAHCCLPQGHA